MIGCVVLLVIFQDVIFSVYQSFIAGREQMDCIEYCFCPGVSEVSGVSHRWKGYCPHCTNSAMDSTGLCLKDNSNSQILSNQNKTADTVGNLIIHNYCQSSQGKIL